MPRHDFTQTRCPTGLQSPTIAIHLDSVRDFVEELRNDSPRIRHAEVRWTSETVTAIGEHTVMFEMLTAGYITEDGVHPKLVELRYPCGRITGTRREDDIASQEIISDALQAIRCAAIDCGLDWRPGRFSLDPSPLMPRTIDVLHRLCVGITTPEGVSYTPWTDGWAIGLECRRRDGYRTFLYLNPSGEMDEGVASVLVYRGTAGDPAEDSPQHWYEPFPDEQVRRAS